MAAQSPEAALGAAMPDFSLPGLDGAPVSLATHGGEKGALVAFICNHCPYVRAIVDRLVADAAEMARFGVGAIAIMPNDYDAYPEDAPEKMAAFAAQHRFAFPYALDASQQVARAYGAVCTPDFFLLDADRRLRYRGRLDNFGSKPPSGERTPELLDAARAIAEGRAPAEPQHPSIGCSVKWRA